MFVVSFSFLLSLLLSSVFVSIVSTTVDSGAIALLLPRCFLDSVSSLLSTDIIVVCPFLFPPSLSEAGDLVLSPPLHLH